jgi:hypothetical protein
MWRTPFGHAGFFPEIFLLRQPVMCGCDMENIYASLMLMWSNGATPGHHMATTFARAQHGHVAMAVRMSNVHYFK